MRPFLMAFLMGLFIAVFLGPFGISLSHAKQARPAHIVEFGANFHTGETTASATGSMTYLLSFRAERKKGFFRPFVGLGFEYGAGNATIKDETTRYTLYGSVFSTGINVFPYHSGHVQPFLGAAGVVGAHTLKIPSPPEGTEENTHGISMGYEVSAGVDIRFGSAEGNTLRLRGSFWSVSSPQLGPGSFQLNGWRLQMGFGFYR